MSWLYTLVIAGLMLGNDGILNGKQYSYADTNTAQTVKLDESERFEQIYPLNANGRVSVSNVNGSIVIEAWDNPQVKLEAVKTADSREALAEVEVEVDARPDSFSVEADYRDNVRNGKGWKSYRKLEVQFRLMVPRTAVLDEIETVNGSVAVSNFTNYTKVSAVNGDVRATNLRGNANLETVNGTVEADFDRLETGSKIQLNTVNGRVNLVIPSDSNATLKADTVNGSISNDFGLPVRKGEYVGRDLYGRIGGGDVQINLSSVNGGLAINRKNDGKSLSQPTNLLNDKNKRGNDWDDDSSKGPGRVNSEKMNRDIAKSIKESQKALKESQKEVAEALKNVEVEIKGIDQAKLNAEISEAMKEVNSEQVREALKLARLAQSDALAQLSEVRFVSPMPRIEKKSETFSVKGKPKVTIDAKDCDVTVRGWDRPEVQYVVKKYSRSRSQTPIEAKAVQNDSDVKITISDRGAEPARENYDDDTDTRIEVFVPKKTDLKIISDGEIRLENVSGEIDVDGDDEAINVRDVDGSLRVKATDARVRVIGFRGQLDAETEDGDVYLEGDFSRLSARATDGTYTLTLPETTDAVFRSNVEIENLGFNLVKNGDETWRAGKGAAKYDFNFTDGRLIVRGQNSNGTN